MKTGRYSAIQLVIVLAGMAFAPLAMADDPDSQKPAAAKPEVAEQPRWKFEVSTIILPSAADRRFLSLEDLQMCLEMPSNAPAASLERGQNGGWEFVVRNAHNYLTKREQGMKLWETMSAEAAAEPAGLAGLPFERTGYYKVRKEDVPITILIPQWGLLQIGAFDERTLTLILQFKRVVDTQRPKPAPTSPPPQSPAHNESTLGA